MNKQEFLNQLAGRLSQLPPEEIRTRLEYYEEMLADMMEDGMTEQEAVSRLESPEKIAAQILEELPMSTLVRTRLRPEKGWTTTAVVLALVGAPLWVPLAIAGVSVVASLYLTIWAVVVSIYAAVFACGAAGTAILLESLLHPMIGAGTVLINLGAGLIFLALCLLGVCLCYYVTREMLCVTRWIFVKTKKLFIK